MPGAVGSGVRRGRVVGVSPAVTAGRGRQRGVPRAGMHRAECQGCSGRCEPAPCVLSPELCERTPLEYSLQVVLDGAGL